MRAAFWLTLLLVAGCVEAAPATPRASPSAPAFAAAALPTLQLKSCENLGAVFPVPMQAARDALPPGFEPLLATRVPQDGATLYAIALSCKDAIVDGQAHGATLLSYVEIDVKPSAEYKSPGINDYVVPLLFTAPGAVGDGLAAMRLGNAGAGNITRDAKTPVDITYTVALGSTSFELRGVITGGGGALQPEHFRVLGVQGRAVVSQFDGVTSAGTFGQGALALRSSGDALLAQAQPAAQGFSVKGFDFTLTPV